MPTRERILKAREKANRKAEFAQTIVGKLPATLLNDPDRLNNSDLSRNIPNYLNCGALRFNQFGEPYLPTGWGKHGGLEHAERARETINDLRCQVGIMWGNRNYDNEVLKIAEESGYKISKRTLLRYYARTK